VTLTIYKQQNSSHRDTPLPTCDPSDDQSGREEVFNSKLSKNKSEKKVEFCPKKKRKHKK